MPTFGRVAQMMTTALSTSSTCLCYKRFYTLLKAKQSKLECLSVARARLDGTLEVNKHSSLFLNVQLSVTLLTNKLGYFYLVNISFSLKFAGYGAPKPK